MRVHGKCVIVMKFNTFYKKNVKLLRKYILSEIPGAVGLDQAMTGNPPPPRLGRKFPGRLPYGWWPA